jgi:hypothetical protein
LVEGGGAGELAAFNGEAALMLEQPSLQFLVSGVAGSGEGEVVARIGLVVAAGGHEDAGAAAVAGGDLALAAACRLDADAFSATSSASSCWPVLLRAFARSPMVAERLPSSVAALAWFARWPAALPTAGQLPAFHQRLPDADGFLKNGDRLAGSAAVVEHVCPRSPTAVAN